MNHIRQDKGHLIHIDGIDGSGKSTLLGAAREWATNQGLKTFDVVAWSMQQHRLPRIDEIGEADVLITAEPTHVGIGAVIRDEIVREGAPYDARFAAHAFALDRGVQYRRLILPFLRARSSRWVIQDRGLLTSLAYQPLQSERDTTDPNVRVTTEWLLSLEGNRIAHEDPPDVFVFVDIDPQIALERLANRENKFDNHLYEHADFQIALAERYRHPKVHEPLTTRGTRVQVVNGGQTKEAVAEDMRHLLEELSSVVFS